MWIDRQWRALRLVLWLCPLLAGVQAPVLFAEEGQYRSRILLTPPGELGRGAEIGLEELEQRIDSIDDPYARSSAGRYLGRHYAAAGEYDKAAAYYRDALAAAGLSPVVNREMLRELASIYLRAEDYPAALQAMEEVLTFELVPTAGDFLLLAQSYYKLGNYVKAVTSLERIDAAGLTLDAQQMGQALAIYYRAGAWAQCESLLHRLLETQPEEARYWHMLTAVYLHQGLRRKALDQLLLARQKSVPFTEPQLVLLADLHAVNKNPYDGAVTLDMALESGELPATAAHYRKLFEYWFQARERERSIAALQKAAALGGDPELYLYLAQLQQENRQWQAMYATMLKACDNSLAEPYVGRANLLLGVSQLKLGDEAGARRSFINATLVGGVNAQAGQWLAYMEASPPTADELRRLRGICRGVNDKRLDPSTDMNVVTRESSDSGKSALLSVKTVPAMQFFYSSNSEPLAGAMSDLRGRLVRMNVALIRSGGQALGSPHILFTAGARKPGELSRWDLALPTGGAVSGAGRFRLRASAPFDCLSAQYEGHPADFPAALAGFYGLAQDYGQPLSGEGRIVILAGSSEKELQLEVQFGLR